VARYPELTRGGSQRHKEISQGEGREQVDPPTLCPWATRSFTIYYKTRIPGGLSGT